jgi:hypothetical protein
MELRMRLLELVDPLPSYICCKAPHPLDQELPGAAVEACLDDLGGH